jgi:hypothetical protein
MPSERRCGTCLWWGEDHNVDPDIRRCVYKPLPDSITNYPDKMWGCEGTTCPTWAEKEDAE